LLILLVLGWSKLLDLDWWSRKFPRMDSLVRKKNFVMLGRTLATPIINLMDRAAGVYDKKISKQAFRVLIWFV